MPKRIQLSRASGWRKPEGAVMVARPSKWGNPFTLEAALASGDVDDAAAARQVVEAYGGWLEGTSHGDVHQDRRGEILASLPLLAGRDLACWCRLDRPCHADVLLDRARSVRLRHPSVGATVWIPAAPSRPDVTSRWAGTSATGYGEVVRRWAIAQGLAPADYARDRR